MTYSIDLSGRVAFITGASGGLGAQFARTLAAAGAGVVLASRRLDKLKALRAEIEGAGGDAHVVELDVTDNDSIKSAVAHHDFSNQPCICAHQNFHTFLPAFLILAGKRILNVNNLRIILWINIRRCI